MLTHAALFTTAVQLVWQFTLTDPAPPAVPIEAVVGLTVQGGALSCVMVSVAELLPVTVIVACLGVAKVLAATLYEMGPLPVPLPPDVIVTHGASFTAAVQFPGQFTVAVPAPPEPPIVAAVGLIVQGAAPSCVIVRITALLPVTVIVAVLETVPVLAAALYETVPLPVPLDPETIVNHGSLLDALHATPVEAVTAIAPDPPPAGWVTVVGEISKLTAFSVATTRPPR